MQLGGTPAIVLWRPHERILCCARRLNESPSKFALEVSKQFVSQFTQCALFSACVARCTLVVERA